MLDNLSPRQFGTRSNTRDKRPPSAAELGLTNQDGSALKETRRPSRATGRAGKKPTAKDLGLQY